MRRHRILLFSLIVGLLTACGSSTSPPAEQALRVEAEPGQVVVENTGPAAVHFVVVDPDALVQLTAPADWPTLAPGASATTPNDQVVGWTAGTTRAAVYWAVDGQEQEPVEVTLR